MSDFLRVSRRFLDLLGPDEMGSEWEQVDYAIDGIEPALVAVPETVERMQGALAICAEEALATVPVGLGLRLDQGVAPERYDVAMSTAALNRIVEHEAEDLTVTVEAGITLEALNAALREQGQWIPFDPPAEDRTTVGGLIAASAAGPCRQRYGGVRESLIGVRALLADGSSVRSGGRVVKNVAGYDLQKLLVGSFGSLAVIVEASFKLRSLPEHLEVLAFRSESAGPLFELAAEAAACGADPLYLELFADPGAGALLAIALAGLPAEVEEGRRRVASLASRRPELSSAGRPEADEVPSGIEAVVKVERGAASVEGDAVVLRLGAPRRAIGDCFDAAFRELTPVVSKLHAHAHADVGVAHLRLDGGERDGVARALAKLRERLGAVGAYAVVEAAPPTWKSALDVWGPAPDSIELMRRVKAAFDPHRILAPGRFVGGI